MSLKPKRRKLVHQRKMIAKTAIPKPRKTGRDKRFDTTPPHEKTVSTQAKTARDTKYDTTPSVYTILGIQFTSDQPSVDATEAIKHMASKRLTERPEPKSEVLRRVLSFIESKIDGRPAWEKWFVMRGGVCVWIAARGLVPGFKTAEDVLNGLTEKRYRKVFVGVVRAFMPGDEATVECISWLLSENTEETSRES